MARIRTIKPDFWTDGAMVRLTPFARLLYIGMWNFALCDHGHVADDSMKLKLQVLPMDDVDVDELLAELMDEGRIQRLTSPDGRTYLHVKRFEDHQKIDPRFKTRCPACAQQDSLIHAESPTRTAETLDITPDPPKGREGKGREGNKNTSNAALSTEFDAFWKSYPRKVGKDAARKAYAKAAKSATSEEILTGVENLRVEVAGKEQQFIPHPTTWLNAGRWQDEAPQKRPTLTVAPQYGWAN